MAVLSIADCAQSAGMVQYFKQTAGKGKVFMKKTIAFILSVVQLVLLLKSPVTAKFEINSADLTEGAVISQQHKSINAGNLINGSLLGWWAVEGSSAVIDLKRAKTFNTVVLKESTDNVELFRLYYMDSSGNFVMFYEQDRIDKFRLCAFENITSRYLKIEIAKAKSMVIIRDLQITFEAKKDEKFRVNAYMTCGGRQLQNKIHDPGFTGYFDVITDVIMIGSNTMTETGEVVCSDGEENFAKDIADLRTAIGGRVVKIWVCVFNVVRTNDGSDNEKTAAAIFNNADTMAQNLLNFAVKYGLEGIDFDWEYPSTQNQWNAYSLLVEKTSEKLATAGKKVSVALAPWGVGFSREAINALGCVNLMCYDLFDTRGDHSSIYTAGAKAFEYMIDQGYPKDKIYMGIPFYGRPSDGGALWPVYSESFGKWGNINENFEYQKDGQTIKAPSYHNGFAMARDKTAEAVALGFSGIMIFESKCDTPYTYQYSLHKAVKEILDQRVK